MRYLEMLVLAYSSSIGLSCPLAFAQTAFFNPTSNSNSKIFSGSEHSHFKHTASTTASNLQPTLVGIVINGQEVDSLDALFDASAEFQTVNEDLNIKPANNSIDEGKRKQQTQSIEAYFLNLEDISRLTAIEFNPDSDGYTVQTPIGDTRLSTTKVLHNNGQEFVSLSTLKKFGISASYNQQDLAISLNMGWQPKKILAQKNKVGSDNYYDVTPVDYYPSQIGLLGLRINSSINITENNHFFNQKPDSDTTRQVYANIGAFGYAFGGIWGANAKGYETTDINKSHDSAAKREGFASQVWTGITDEPWNISDWDIDNLYWAKSGDKFATRIGINEPNSLGQGAQISGSEFTGAMVAYSNRNIKRHITDLDDNSKSLLQNTSQDYQDLKGVAQPGGVAELRINGRAIARVQIGLDGRYEFLNLDANQLNLTDTLVEVAIFAYPLAREPIELRPIFLGQRRTNVATGEWLVEAGLGGSGNLINEHEDSDVVGHLYTEYGLNNRVAIRAGLNSSRQGYNDDRSLAWQTGINFIPSTYSNADLSYAHDDSHDLWQAQLRYTREKIWANYQYQAKQYKLKQYSADQSKEKELLDQRHQLLLGYRPNNNTSISVNQYYNKLDNDYFSNTNPYYVYTSITHRFSDAFDAAVNWNSQDDYYSYRLFWRDASKAKEGAHGLPSQSYGHNTLGISGNNDSETLTARHNINSRTSLGQSVSHLHGTPHLLYQGDVSHRFDSDFFAQVAGSKNGSYSPISNQLNLGYSLYNNHVGWQADWQFTHRNSIDFSLGYQHHYVSGIPNNTDYYANYIDGVNDPTLRKKQEYTPWDQENYLYIRLSFDMFKAPKQHLHLGRVPRQQGGSLIVDVTHAAEPEIDAQNIKFTLDNQEVQASLLNVQNTQSQYLISNIKPGDYILTMDSKNLPIEYSTGELPTPKVRVSDYAPTSVPISLQKTYGISAKLADAKEGVLVEVYEHNNLIKTLRSGSYGYFQIMGLAPDTYTLKVQGYESKTVTIDNDFVMQVEIQPNVSVVSSDGMVNEHSNKS